MTFEKTDVRCVQELRLWHENNWWKMLNTSVKWNIRSAILKSCGVLGTYISYLCSTGSSSNAGSDKKLRLMPVMTESWEVCYCVTCKSVCAACWQPEIPLQHQITTEQYLHSWLIRGTITNSLRTHCFLWCRNGCQGFWNGSRLPKSFWIINNACTGNFKTEERKISCICIGFN